MGERSLTNSRHVLHQQVSGGEKRHYSQTNGFGLALDHGLDGLLQTLDLFHRLGDD